jgi:amino-acid N-acetyltransferase
MNVADLREILQYVPRFRDRIFVIAVDGEIAGSENFANTLLDVAVLRSLNIRVVLVHGAGEQIRSLASLRNVRLSNSDGTGMTDDATLQVSIDAGIRLTNEIMEGLSAVDLRAGYLNAVVAHPAGILGGKDQGYTGRVERVDTKALNLLLEEGIIPVVPPLGFDGEGRTFRVNSDSIAVEVAEALRAAKVIFLGPRGLLGEGDLLPRQLSIAEAEDFVKKAKPSQLSQGLLSKLNHAAHACRLGIPRVHLLDGSVNEALLAEVFSNEGIGTMVHSNEYQQIRRIFKKDVRGVLSLIRQSVKNEELIRRTRGEILEHLEDYWILEIDRNPIACVALHPYPDSSCGELACLHVSKAHENQGFGRKLMSFVETQARQRGLRRLYALSTQAYHFFEQKGGFVLAGPEVLPPSRRERYMASGRNSRILVKELLPASTNG